MWVRGQEQGLGEAQERDQGRRWEGVEARQVARPPPLAASIRTRRRYCIVMYSHIHFGSPNYANVKTLDALFGDPK